MCAVACVGVGCVAPAPPGPRAPPPARPGRMSASRESQTLYHNGMCVMVRSTWSMVPPVACVMPVCRGGVWRVRVRPRRIAIGDDTS